MAGDHGKQSLLGNGHRLDLVSVPGVVVLRTEEGSEVATFCVCDASSKGVEQAAQEHQRTNQKVQGLLTGM
jgi:phosphoribosylamine-glycine ligase